MNITKLKITFLALFLILVVTSCQNEISNEQQPIPNDTNSDILEEQTGIISIDENGYPVSSIAQVDSAGYPVPTPSGLLTQLPDSPKLISPEDGFATIGGAIVDPVDGGGYIPIAPQSIALGEIVSDDQGRPIFLRSTDVGQKAQLLNAGVFVFNGVEPGRYGLVIDLGIGTFPILDNDGSILLFDVVAGEALDLGVLSFELE